MEYGDCLVGDTLSKSRSLNGGWVMRTDEAYPG